jgi:DNA-binding NarL/FixJ family response regulator
LAPLGYRADEYLASAQVRAESSEAPDIVVLALEGSRNEVALELAELRGRLTATHRLLVVPERHRFDRRFAVLGADGLVYESELDRTLGPAIDALMSGLAVLPLELNAAAVAPNFSAREKQVLGMVVMGLSNVEIATRLFLAESTIKSHLSSAFRKLGVASRKDAVARILDPEHGLGPGILAISNNAPVASDPPPRAR